MRYLGIDPGQSGGIAVLDKSSVIGAWKMPDTEKDVLELIREFSDSTAALEMVRSRPMQGAPGMFRFAWNYGGLRMALLASDVPFRECTPATWQRGFGLLNKLTGTAKKNANKARAQELFPGLKITHAIADALLIAEWLRRQG